MTDEAQKRRVAEIEANWACKCGNTLCDGLDCGVYLPGCAPRKKALPKSREEMAAIRAKAWESRRRIAAIRAEARARQQEPK